MKAEGSIFVGCVGSVAWVQINGPATHENAACIKQFLRGRYEDGWRRFVIDLGRCPGIDSTFIGLLYRLAVDVEKADPAGSVEVIRPGERNESSIRKLGLDLKIRIDREGERWEKERRLVEENISRPLPCEPLDKLEKTQMLLEAHEALAAANAENRSRFCDVVEFLKRDLEAQTAKR